MRERERERVDDDLLGYPLVNIEGANAGYEHCD